MEDDLYDDIFSQKKNLPVSTKPNKNVKTVEEKVKLWQEIANRWRTTITQNEKVIVIFCMLAGFVYSYAVNECTGNFDVPIYVYAMAFGIVILCSLLLIAEKTLPLLVLVKFSAAAAFGHVAMMFLIVADGPIGVFTVATCSSPVTIDSVMVWLFGSGTGYIAANFQME